MVGPDGNIDTIRNQSGGIIDSHSRHPRAAKRNKCPAHVSRQCHPVFPDGLSARTFTPWEVRSESFDDVNHVAFFVFAFRRVAQYFFIRKLTAFFWAADIRQRLRLPLRVARSREGARCLRSGNAW